MARKSNRIAAFAGIVVTTLVASAWSGDVGSAAGSEPPTGGTPPRAPKTWTVQMKNDGGVNRFEPNDIKIMVGDTVKWLDVTGTHNVQFWPDSVPRAALPLLKKATASDSLSIATLSPGASFTMVFANAPKGIYKYFCTPHFRRGQRGTITVQ